MNCRVCGKTITDFTKHIGYGPKAGKVYHYMAHCLGGHTYHVKRTKEIYLAVKDQEWVRSKSYDITAHSRSAAQYELFERQDAHLQSIKDA